MLTISDEEGAWVRCGSGSTMLPSRKTRDRSGIATTDTPSIAGENAVSRDWARAETNLSWTSVLFRERTARTVSAAAVYARRTTSSQLSSMAFIMSSRVSWGILALSFCMSEP